MKKKILVVDDEKDFVELVKARLEACGYDIITAYNGKEALDKVRDEAPDLMLLDLMIPEISGYNVCLKIKVDKIYKKIPIIILTAKFQPSDLKFGKELGADGYLTKPFEPQELLDKIKGLLKEGRH